MHYRCECDNDEGDGNTWHTCYFPLHYQEGRNPLACITLIQILCLILPPSRWPPTHQKRLSLNPTPLWDIEFCDSESVNKAIALSGKLCCGQPVMVFLSEAERNLAQSNTTTGGVDSTGPIYRKLYVTNLESNVTELQLKEIFSPFGLVELLELPLDFETGQCKGFGFVQFSQLEDSKAAQNAALNGELEIAGRTMKVSFVTDHVRAEALEAQSKGSG